MSEEKKEEVLKQKKIALDNTIKHLERSYGKNILMRLGNQNAMNIDSFPSGSLSLDKALGIGGYPRGRIIEVYGPESSGKTTLTLHAIAEVQKKGGICAFVDAEHALDTNYAKKIGIDIDNLYVSQPSDGEQALEVVDELINSHAIDLIVVDSVAALVPKAEIEGNMGDAQMALQARLMSQALRKITGSLSKTKTSIIFINQLRMKIGVFFGNPETTTGGNALKFYASVRIDIRKTETLKKGEDVYGVKAKVKIIKNKVAPPFKIAQFDILYGEGISSFLEILDIAVKNDIIKKSGSWFSYNEERIGQGQESVKQFLKDNPKTFKTIEKRVKEIMGLTPASPTVANKTTSTKTTTTTSTRATAPNPTATKSKTTNNQYF